MSGSELIPKPVYLAGATLACVMSIAYLVWFLTERDIDKLVIAVFNLAAACGWIGDFLGGWAKSLTTDRDFRRREGHV